MAGKKKEPVEDPRQKQIRLMAERAKLIDELIEAWLLDFARLLAGHSAEFPYMDRLSADLLRRTAQPFLDTGERLRPDFGEWAKRVIIYDDAKPGDPVRVQVTWRDQSTLEAPPTEDGRPGGRKRNEPQDVTAELLVRGDGREIGSVRFWAGAGEPE